jgi:hypothetical protein
LCEKGFAELLGPSEVFIEPFDDVRITREVTNAFIPRLIFKRERSGLSREETSGQDDVGGFSGCG